MGCDPRRRNTPVVSPARGSLVIALVLLANFSSATAELSTFIILLSTVAALVLYLAGRRGRA